MTYCTTLFVSVGTNHNDIVAVHSAIALRAGDLVPGCVQNKVAVVVGVVVHFVDCFEVGHVKIGCVEAAVCLEHGGTVVIPGGGAALSALVMLCVTAARVSGLRRGSVGQSAGSQRVAVISTCAYKWDNMAIDMLT
jgi:hypothetical protein